MIIVSKKIFLTSSIIGAANGKLKMFTRPFWISFSYNVLHFSGSGRFNTGENLYWYSITDFGYKLDINMVLSGWFDEHRDYTYRPLSGSDFGGSAQIGHYTQVR